MEWSSYCSYGDQEAGKIRKNKVNQCPRALLLHLQGRDNLMIECGYFMSVYSEPSGQESASGNKVNQLSHFLKGEPIVLDILKSSSPKNLLAVCLLFLRSEERRVR